jgi:hypothetical protein
MNEFRLVRLPSSYSEALADNCHEFRPGKRRTELVSYKEIPRRKQRDRETHPPNDIAVGDRLIISVRKAQIESICGTHMNLRRYNGIERLSESIPKKFMVQSFCQRQKANLQNMSYIFPLPFCFFLGLEPYSIFWG